MPTTTMKAFIGRTVTVNPTPRKRIESIDLLRGAVMIIMALDHVRDYFHKDAFIYSPTDLSQTTGILFFTRFITHYCAPVFVFLAGISAYLYGVKKTKSQLAYYLFTRGLWLIFAELFIISLARTFNPAYTYVNLQVIWAIGVSMIFLAGLIFLNRASILAVGLVLIFGHNLLDNVHVDGNGTGAFAWAILHDSKHFVFGSFAVYVHYPLLPWIGIMATGYFFGSFYSTHFNSTKRKKILLLSGCSAIAVFILLRGFNIYGDASTWHQQKSGLFNLLSFVNVTKYPPSLLYTLITLGPAMVVLSFIEKPLNRFTGIIAVYGRVPFFYYVVHLYLIHLAALIAAVLSGYNWQLMILSDRLNEVAGLKGYGFNLIGVYLVWIGLIAVLYPLCKVFDRYKRKYQQAKPWLSYL
jgi:uncharacterized membrane protein